MSTLRRILLNIEEMFTFVWINAVADYFCSTVSRITELSMKGICPCEWHTVIMTSERYSAPSEVLVECTELNAPYCYAR